MPPVASTASTANGGTLLKKDHLAAAEAKALVGERTVYQVHLQDFQGYIWGDQWCELSGANTMDSRNLATS